MRRRGVTPNFSAEVDVGERAIGSELDVVVNKGPKGGDKEGRVVVKLGVVGDGS